MIIPIDKVSTTVLDSIVQEFVSREGTEYGSEEMSFDEKIAQVIRQLQQGSAVLVYSELHESVNILPAEQFEQADFNE